MAAYYNEFDPHAAAWLRELIKEKLIAPGVVDERSITEVSPADLAEYTQCHFFAGVGVWSFALRNAGWPDDRPVWTGSCPCQPFSAAGIQSGSDDERHLWPAFEHLIAYGKPDAAPVIGEQVASWQVVGRTDGKPKDTDGPAWIDTVQNDLEEQGHASGFVVFPAACFSDNIRDRCYWMGDTGSEGLQGHGQPGVESVQERWQGKERFTRSTGSHVLDPGRDGKRRSIESCIEPFIDGTPKGMVRSGNPSLPFDSNYTQEARTMRLRGYGNALNADAAKVFVECVMDQTQIKVKET